MIQYDEQLLRKNMLSFEGKMFQFDPDKSKAWVSLPYPAVKKLAWNKDTTLKIWVTEIPTSQIEKYKEKSQNIRKSI